MDLGAVGLYRSPGQMQLVGDLDAGMAKGDQSKYLCLARTEAIAADCVTEGPNVGRDVRAEVLLAAGGPLHGLGELVVSSMLEHESDRAGVERLLGENGTRLHGQNHDLRLRSLGA